MIIYEPKITREKAKEILDYAKKNGRKDIAFDIKYSLFRSKFILPFLRITWKLSARLKKKSRAYKTFIKLIKNDHTQAQD